MLLIKNIEVYAPEYLGTKDIFVAGGKICRVADSLEFPIDPEIEVVDGKNFIATPGFIDNHVHILGGGGEGGFAMRTPEVTLSDLTPYGVTTVVGLLGTDGIAREMTSLIAKTKSLKEQGISAYCMTGSYQIPVRTLTGDIIKDIMMVDEIIGVGEIAISDHRSSQPSFGDFKKLVADARVGGMLSGKAGIVDVHLGTGKKRMELIERVVNETEIPITQFLPTHVSRSKKLFERALDFAKLGGTIDFTGNENNDYDKEYKSKVVPAKAIKRMLDEGISDDLFTISSDGQGSLPRFDADGKLIGMGIGKSSCLIKEIRDCVTRADIPLEVAIKGITSNPARILCLKNKGRIEEGKDADICIMTKDLQIDTVIAMGQVMVRHGDMVVKGYFE